MSVESQQPNKVEFIQLLYLSNLTVRSQNVNPNGGANSQNVEFFWKWIQTKYNFKYMLLTSFWHYWPFLNLKNNGTQWS